MKHFALVLLAAVFATPALSDELPGVDRPKQIVQPQSEPLDEQAATDKDAVRVGDWDVKVSGSIVVDVGVGNIKPPRR